MNVRLEKPYSFKLREIIWASVQPNCPIQAKQPIRNFIKTREELGCLAHSQFYEINNANSTSSIILLIYNNTLFYKHCSRPFNTSRTTVYQLFISDGSDDFINIFICEKIISEYYKGIFFILEMKDLNLCFLSTKLSTKLTLNCLY